MIQDYFPFILIWLRSFNHNSYILPPMGSHLNEFDVYHFLSDFYLWQLCTCIWNLPRYYYCMGLTFFLSASIIFLWLMHIAVLASIYLFLIWMEFHVVFIPRSFLFPQWWISRVFHASHCYRTSYKWTFTLPCKNFSTYIPRSWTVGT